MNMLNIFGTDSLSGDKINITCRRIFYVTIHDEEAK